MKEFASPNVARASAPASIGNVAVGYDVFGQAFDAVRDMVTAHRESKPGVRLGKVTGLFDTLPGEVHKNTALAAADALLKAAKADFGVRLDVDKGVPMSAGMGGSAASAVAAAAAVNALLETPYATEDLLLFAIEGERVSADPPPWDNVMAALLGGLVMAANLESALVKPIPLPDGLVTILFHPDAKTDTQAARELLSPEVEMNTVVEHSRRISAFILGCATGDRALLRVGMEDILVEPQRAPLLPELLSVKDAAMKAGAIGCSFSGSGPSVFAWAEEADAAKVEAAMAAAFALAGRGATAYHAPPKSEGARLEPVVENA